MANQNRAISSFDVIRKLVRNLYLEGFNNYLETESLGKSSRAFTNNLNSIRNFLDSRFMSSKTSTKKKSNPVICFDTREQTENPLFALWKTQNSLPSNLSFDFAIMDILEDNPNGIGWFSLTSDSDSNKHDNLLSNYVSKGIDKKGVKAKLEKLAEAGVIEFSDNKKEIRKTNTKHIKQLLSSKEVKQAIQFASETCPLGVIGSYILDNLKTLDSEPVNTPIHYKHHFIFNSIDYEIMYVLMEAITNKRFAEIETEKNGVKTIVPLKVFISTQTGRTYIIFWDVKEERLFSENLEQILSSKETDFCNDYNYYHDKLTEIEPYMWGVSFKNSGIEPVKFIIEYQSENEKKYIPARIKRESVIGTVTELDDSHSEFKAELLDAKEIIPWIRSFFGRITEINSPYSERILEDITLISKEEFRKTGNLQKHIEQSNYEIINEPENTPLFGPLYSSYYLIVRNILEAFIKNDRKPLRGDSVTKIIEATTFIDSKRDIYDFTDNCSEVTTIFSSSSNGVSSPIKHIPDFPLSIIELRFLATIIKDNRIRMFFEMSTLEELELALKDVKPLWIKENVKYFDQNKDADSFENSVYKELFMTLLKAINNKNYIQLIYGRKDNRNIFTPTHMDYSQKDDTFRLFVKELKYPINLVNIKSCTITQEKPSIPEESTVYETLKVEVFDDTASKYHFNRAIRQFSYFKKTCQKTEEENIYEMTVDYDKSDESEIVIKTLMFGPNMKVLEPQAVVEELKTRISKQQLLFTQFIDNTAN